jgi:hypothetical protein
MARHHAEVMNKQLDIKAECADLEHAEPGTGSPPEPREQESDLNTERQHRRDTPPIVEELEDQMELTELIGKLKAAGIEVPDDATEDTVVELVANMNKELEPLREAVTAAESKQEFRKLFPEEAARMENLEKKDKETEAKMFSQGYARFVKADAPLEKLPHGFSSLVLQKVEDFHLALSSRQATVEDFKAVLDNIANNGIVDYSERGSSQKPVAAGDLPIAVTSDNPRRQFAEVVNHYMTEDELDRTAAIKHAAENHPELFEAYRQTVPA